MVHVLEHMPVEKAWALLDDLSSQVAGKQTELQLMVGSRYHELIESADSIVSMKETSVEVLGLLRSFPRACSNVLQQVPPASPLTPAASDVDMKNPIAGNISEVVQLMLHAPAAMWAALDSNRVLEAANLLLRCRSCWADLSRSFSSSLDSSVSAFLRSHVTYVEQFPRRIMLAGTHLLTRSSSTRETAGALAALLQLQASKDHSPLRCLLELLLRRRGGAVVAMLRRAVKTVSSDSVEVLQTAVATVQRTIVDVHAIFAPRLDGSCLLEELAQPSNCTQVITRLPTHVVRELCTSWLSILSPKIRVSSEQLLRSIGEPTSLSRIRGALWKATHDDGAWVISSLNGRGVVRDKAADEARWAEAASFAVDVSAVRGSTYDRGLGAASLQLDLWSLLFSKIFADLAETLLRESLLCIRKDVECRIDSILLAVTGSDTRLGAHEGARGFANHLLHQPDALMAHDILAAADTVVTLLASEIRDLVRNAIGLTERRDKTAQDALKTSFYLLSVDMATGLANYLRVALREILACIKAAAKQQQQCLPYADGISDLDGAVGSLADAGLVIGRVAWMLSGSRGQPLHAALSPPGCFKKLHGRIEEQQLQAAFVIADTDGDGVVDTEEAAEALQAISFGTSAALALDPSPFPSLTLSEFSLFATRLLEEQRPRQHLHKCLQSLLEISLNMWAEWALEKAAALLTDRCNTLAMLCTTAGLTDDLWRKAHGIWEDRVIELDRDDGNGFQETVHLPIMVSPAILCYIEGVAAELGRILSTTDLGESATDETRSLWESQDSHLSASVESAVGSPRKGKATGQGAARYARAVAAMRASSDLRRAMLGLCEGPRSAAAQACEAAQLQLLLDALFLQEWVEDSPTSTSSMDSVVATLYELVDPINLQLYMPHLQMAASACLAACHTSLSLIFERNAPSGTRSSVSMSPDGALGSTSSFVALAPKARRFTMLPLPLDAVRLQHPNGVPRVRDSGGHKPGLTSSDDSAASAQARGIEAGRQALAGLMGQVGSVGSVLSAQNVNVQSVFGAASLFLGGRNRRGVVEESMY